MKNSKNENLFNPNIIDHSYKKMIIDDKTGIESLRGKTQQVTKIKEWLTSNFDDSVCLDYLQIDKILQASERMLSYRVGDSKHLHEIDFYIYYSFLKLYLPRIENFSSQQLSSSQTSGT